MNTDTTTTELFGDPEGLAKHQFRTALELCAECRDYHAVWPYRRLSRMIFGIEASADLSETLLKSVTPRNGRILIAGAADAGMLALTHKATSALTPSIDVADRCPTPLAICRRYARRRGLSIGTLHLDFGELPQPQRYDVVFGDCVLQFLPRRFRVAFLRRIGKAMTDRGALILVERLRTGSEERSRRKDYASVTLSALAKQGVRLPEAEAAFRRRLDNVVNARRTRISHASERLESVLAEAGFDVSDSISHERMRCAILPNGERVTVEIAVASPGGTGPARNNARASVASRKPLTAA